MFIEFYVLVKFLIELLQAKLKFANQVYYFCLKFIHVIISQTYGCCNKKRNQRLY